MPPAVFLHPQNAPKSLAAGASLNQLNNDRWIKGVTSKGRGGKGRVIGGKER